MPTQTTTRCEFCECTDESVATRPGRGAQALCDGCDAWISDRMRAVTVSRPDDARADGTASGVDADARSLALDPDLDATVALEFSAGVSYEAIGQLEAAGFETVEDLWVADRDALTDVPHVTASDVDAIRDTISTTPGRDPADIDFFDVAGDEDDERGEDGERPG